MSGVSSSKKPPEDVTVLARSMGRVTITVTGAKIFTSDSGEFHMALLSEEDGIVGGVYLGKDHQHAKENVAAYLAAEDRRFFSVKYKDKSVSKMEIGMDTIPTFAAMLEEALPKIGPMRVYAAMDANKDEVVIFGYGIYDGMKPSRAGFPNPRIVLDSGEEVWGYECWWGPEAKLVEFAKGRPIKVVSITEEREKSRALRAKEDGCEAILSVMHVASVREAEVIWDKMTEAERAQVVREFQTTKDDADTPAEPQHPTQGDSHD